jgi:hypothetical protein
MAQDPVVFAEEQGSEKLRVSRAKTSVNAAGVSRKLSLKVT